MCGFWVKINRESGVRVLIAVFNSPAVLVAESFCDGETEAGAFFRFIGLIEAIEDFSGSSVFTLVLSFEMKREVLVRLISRVRSPYLIALLRRMSRIWRISCLGS